MTDAVPPAQPTTAPTTTPTTAPSRWRSYGLPSLVMLAWFGTFAAAYGVVQAAVVLTDTYLHPVVVPVAVAGVVAFVVAYVLGRRLVDRQPVEELAPRGAAREVALGLLLGAVAFSAALGLLVAAGAYDVRRGSGLLATGTALALSVMSGVCEEVIFRGIFFRRLAVPFGTYGALAASSLFFGLAHFANPGATLWSSAAIALEAGLMLGLAYVATGRLWLPIGLHIAWNYVQGGVFGVAVSGNDVGGSLLVSTPEAGRDALTGGAFGAEASPAALVVCLAVAAALWVVVRRRGLVVPPAWRRPVAGQTVSSTLPM